MAQYMSFSPDAQVAGRVIISTFDAIGAEALPFLEKYHLVGVDANSFYPQQAFLDALKEIVTRETKDPLDLVGVGIKVAERSIFPPTVNTVEAGLLALGTAYQKNNRSSDNTNVGSYHVHTISDTRIDVIAENPFPCDMVYGVIYGTVRRFKSATRDYTVFHDYAQPCRKKGDLTCTYHIEWKEEGSLLDKLLTPKKKTSEINTSAEVPTTSQIVNDGKPKVIR